MKPSNYECFLHLTWIYLNPLYTIIVLHHINTDFLRLWFKLIHTQIFMNKQPTLFSGIKDNPVKLYTTFNTDKCANGLPWWTHTPSCWASWACCQPSPPQDSSRPPQSRAYIWTQEMINSLKCVFRNSILRLYVWQVASSCMIHFTFLFLMAGFTCVSIISLCTCLFMLPSNQMVPMAWPSTSPIQHMVLAGHYSI